MINTQTFLEVLPTFLIYAVLFCMPLIAFDNLYATQFFERNSHISIRITKTDYFALRLIPVMLIVGFIINFSINANEPILMYSTFLLYIACIGLVFKMIRSNTAVQYINVFDDTYIKNKER